MIKIVVIIAMIVNVLMFVVNAMQVKAAHVDLDADQMHYSIRLCVKNVVSLIELPRDLQREHTLRHVTVQKRHHNNNKRSSIICRSFFSLLICIVPCGPDIIPDVLIFVIQVIRDGELTDKSILKSAFIEINMAVRIICKG